MTSKLDRELAKALEGAPVPGADEPPSAHRPEGAVVMNAQGARDPKRRGNVRLLAILLAMGAGIVVLVMTSFKDAAVYAKQVDEVVAARSSLSGRRLRVEGNLVHGS